MSSFYEMKLSLLLIFLTVLGACSRSPTINLKNHSFNRKPKHVIWLQIPGFELEHVSLIRFSTKDSKALTAFEDVSCIGSLWSYNFYDLRANASDSYLSQMTGSLDVVNHCPSDDRFPAWQYYRSLGFNSVAIEAGVDDAQSLLNHSKCQGEKFLDGLTLLTMKKASSKTETQQLFHYQSSPELKTNSVHFDQACQERAGQCFSTLFGNVRSVWQGLMKTDRSQFLVIRDFSYLRSLKAGNIVLAREALSEVDKVLRYIYEMTQDQNVLILVTGAETLSLKLPAQGSEWGEFEKRGKSVLLERPRLVSPVLAKGSMAENFCGSFESSQVLYRQLWISNDREFSLKKLIE